MSKQPYKDKYPHLFTPLTIARTGKTYKNRFFVSPIGLMPHHHWQDGVIGDAGVDFYAQFARGGYASIATQIQIPAYGTRIDEESKGFVYMHNLQRAAHAFDCRTALEIFHPGCCVFPGQARNENDYLSADTFEYNGTRFRGMNEDDMEMVIQMYRDAAHQARRAGFDTIIFHVAHGWLMSNFLSPLFNHRTDKYGGSVENRCRFPVAVAKAIRETVPGITLELRMNGSDMHEGGITPDDAAQQALIFQDYVDLIHVSCGTRIDADGRAKHIPTGFEPDAHNTDAAWTLKKAGVKVPVGVVAGIHTAELAESILAEGKADYVLMGRQAIADPDFVNKVREGREEDIRPCIRCSYCLDGGRRNALTTEVRLRNDTTFDMRCSINPEYGQGLARVRTFRPSTGKKVAVIGGGIAGMNAALTAAQNGHDVVLYEKSDRLGGQINLFAERMWFKRCIRKYRDYLICQLKKSSVKVLLETPATPKSIDEANFDAVIVAVGAKQSVPPIPGIDGANVTLAWDVFGNEEKLGKKLVLVGGGSVGCETAIYLAEKGHDVTVLEMTPFYAATAETSERTCIGNHFKSNGIKVLVNTRCVEIGEKGVTIEGPEGRSFLEADSVVVSAGSKPEAEVRDSFAGVAFDVINVGDCYEASNIRNAMDTAWCAVNRI